MDEGRIEAADALEEVGDLLVLPAELGGVVDVLVLASAAFAVIGASGFDAFGGCRVDAGEDTAGEALVDLGDLHLDHVTGAGVRDEDDELAHPTDAFAAEGQVVDGELDAFAVGEGRDDGCGIIRGGSHRRK
jgi:hypothetical protein